MSTSPLAGQPVPRDLLVNVPRLVTEYFTRHPDPADPAQRIGFGTSGHRGSSLEGSFNEDHILAICQAVSEYRAEAGIDGPLLVGMDTHALSEPAFATALEVFAANGVSLLLDEGLGYVPTPVLSHAILNRNRERGAPRADGVVITPSHNPPADGGFKYNPPSGGPASTEVTAAIQRRANEILEGGLKVVKRVSVSRALLASTTGRADFIGGYVRELGEVLDLETVREAGLRIGVDPLGGSSLRCWAPIAERYGLDVTVVNDVIDPTFSFMPLDRDGKIRMDCSSPAAMAGLIGMKGSFDIAVATDPDADRHGIVTPSTGLMNPNHYLSVVIGYLFRNRPGWPAEAGVGKTLVSSSMIDRVAADLGRRLVEVPVGFKWFVDGLLDGSLGFGGEESAGASFLRRDGSVWTTDKDGILLALLAAEITARSDRDPGELYAELESRFGSPVYARLDAPATPAQKAVLAALSPEQVKAKDLAGEPITARLTRAPGNGAPIGGLKVTAENGWFAARPSGTEDVYKIYAESFLGPDHLRRIQEEARAIVDAAPVVRTPLKRRTRGRVRGTGPRFARGRFAKRLTPSAWTRPILNTRLSHARQLVLFGLVGGFGTMLNTAILWVLHTGVGLHYLAAAAVATESAIVSNFLGNEHITFASEGHGNGKLRRFLRFQLVSIGTLAGTLSLLWLLVQLLGESRVLLCNLIAIGGMFLVNFAVNRTLTWKLPRPAEPERGESLAR